MTWYHSHRMTSAGIALDAGTAALLSFVDQLSEDACHRPLPGGWTPAGHVEHVALTNDVFLGVLKGGAGCSGPISPYQGTSDYSDSTWSMDAPPPATAPPILIPSAGIDRVAASAHLRSSSARLCAAIRDLDTELALYCVRLPWAAVSVYQMCEWASGHTLRHITQINRELQIGVMRAPQVEQI
ncbi:MAG: DinB family protein [Vicinamibacterales bacterium]